MWEEKFEGDRKWLLMILNRSQQALVPMSKSQASYIVDPALSAGQQPGIASSALNNKALRQATSIAAAFAQYMANVTGNDVLDDGVQSELLATIALAFGSNTPTVTQYLSGSGTYTVPAGTKYLRIRGIGGGGGAGAGSASTGVMGVAGTATTFGSSFITANGGSPGSSLGGGGVGGTFSLAGGLIDCGCSQGGQGQGAGEANVSNVAIMGGQGASTPFCGGGAGAVAGTGANGQNAIANSGAGGGGGCGNAGLQYAGSGGGAGAWLDVIVPFSMLSPTFAYAIGGGGAGGSDSSNGGNGGSGRLVIEAY